MITIIVDVQLFYVVNEARHCLGVPCRMTMWFLVWWTKDFLFLFLTFPVFDDDFLVF